MICDLRFRISDFGFRIWRGVVVARLLQIANRKSSQRYLKFAAREHKERKEEAETVISRFGFLHVLRGIVRSVARMGIDASELTATPRDKDLVLSLGSGRIPDHQAGGLTEISRGSERSADPR